MDIFGNNGNNPFDQNLNTTDTVDFTRVDVSGAIVDNSQLATKLYVDTHGGGGGNMNYTGTTPATNYIYKASASNGQDAIKSSITDDGTNCVVSATNGITANKIIKSGGTAIQYLMGDGTTLTQSANSGNSNFYLYKSKNGITTPPPLAGDVGYNNAVQSLATLVYISHLTRDNIDIEVFYNQVNQLNDLYIQDQNNSINFIKYNITGLPSPVINSYTAIPVLAVSSGGTGATSFGSTHNVLLAFFSNLSEVDTRLSTLETKTQNQAAIAGTTVMSGMTNAGQLRYVSTLYSGPGGDMTIGGIGNNVTVTAGQYITLTATSGVICNSALTANSFIKSGGLATEFLKADGNVDSNSYVSQSGLYNPTGLGNIDIMLRDSPFIGLQYNNGTAVNTLSNTLFSQLGNTGQFAPAFALTNNFTRQLISADWITVSLADGIPCGYASNGTNGCRVGSGFNFGLSAILGIADSTYNVNNCQNFWGLWNSSNAIPLTQSIQLSVQRNMICFGSDTNDPNICIYTAGASSTVKQVDLGVSFPANRPSAALSTDWFKFTLYWDVTKIYYKAHNTTTHVIVSGSFTPLAADMPLSNIVLLPQCVRIQGSPQSNGQGRLKVQRFGIYYN